MDNWKIQLVIVTFCALVQTYQRFSLKCFLQDESLQTSLTSPMSSVIKRSKALRFYGLMGKRSDAKKPYQVKRRNKGEMFVGLMGRSISSGESLPKVNRSAKTTATHDSENPYKQGTIVPV
uniref:Uncharacterized protein n=1 Tax=Pundamilia nyererei TaxID=303518 RepID=A0A3B4GV47_9CICH